MRLDDQRESGNFQDDTGRGGMGFGGGGGGGGLGLIFSFIASRFGIVGIIVFALGYCALTSLGGLGGGVMPSSSVSAPSGKSSLDPTIQHFTLKVLGSTEDIWGKLFATSGSRYEPTTLVYYSDSDNSGCGAAQSAMGPFYCPTDKKIYLDTSFFNELSQRFQAPGAAAILKCKQVQV